MTTIAEQRKKPARHATHGVAGGWKIQTGNTVRVWQKIKEGEKMRLQAFEGLVIARKHGYEPGGTFTVRKISEGIGVERIFPVFSPNIDKVDLVRKSKARKSKLYYVREKAAKEIRRKMKYIKIEQRKKIADVAPLPGETPQKEQ